MVSHAPADAEPPAPPRLPPGPATDIDPDLDPEFPDLEGLHLEDVTVSYPSARVLTVIGTRLVRCTLDQDLDQRIDATDAELIDIDLTGRTLDGGTRIRFVGCRMGGIDLGGARLRDVVFEDCVLDLASMRTATLERVVVRGGRVDGLDLTAAVLRDVVVDGVGLDGVTLDGARLERVDLRGADLTAVREMGALRGATISEVQAIALAGRLARAAGIHVAPSP